MPINDKKLIPFNELQHHMALKKKLHLIETLLIEGWICRIPSKRHANDRSLWFTHYETDLILVLNNTCVIIRDINKTYGSTRYLDLLIHQNYPTYLFAITNELETIDIAKPGKGKIPFLSIYVRQVVKPIVDAIKSYKEIKSRWPQPHVLVGFITKHPKLFPSIQISRVRLKKILEIGNGIYWINFRPSPKINHSYLMPI